MPASMYSVAGTQLSPNGNCQETPPRLSHNKPRNPFSAVSTFNILSVSHYSFLSLL